MLFGTRNVENSNVKCYFYQRKTCPKHSRFKAKCMTIQYVPLNNVLHFRELRGKFPWIKMKVRFDLTLPPYAPGCVTQTNFHYFWNNGFPALLVFVLFLSHYFHNYFRGLSLLLHWTYWIKTTKIEHEKCQWNCHKKLLQWAL